MGGTTMDEIERPYDGCGKCLLGVRRLSRVKAATTSPERQREDVLTAAAAIGGHIIDWAAEVHGDVPAAEVPAVGADEPALLDGDTSSHAKEHVQEVLALRDAEVGAVQAEVAAGRFVVDGVTEEVFLVSI
ncbi:hypothetical protein ACWGN5_14655 [Streptomyces sp. NPDC055815]